MRKIETVNTKRLAEIFGITERRVQQMAVDGILKKKGRGRFVLSDSVQKYIMYHIELERKKFKKHDMDINEARKRREIAEATLKEIDLQKREGEILEKSDVLQLWQKILSILRNRLLNIPSKLSPQLIGMNTINEIKIKLDEEIYQILNELSDSTTFE
jgi:phage terminase Nu1 subunit (DNA packaging protein)